MDLSFGPENEAFRETVRGFLREAWTPVGLKGPELGAYIKAFRQQATDAGYLYRGVPKRYGGSEQAPDVLKAQVIRDEFARARAPMEVPGNGMNMLVPTLLDRGEDWQREKFIPPTVTGEIQWAQGYSEPGSGSDLASVRTRGVLEGDKWLINGQKIWTSMADRCQYMFALIRTEPEAAKHAGISYLLIDLRQPGVTIRPLKQMTGGSEFAEVFFDNATTPADWIVGERGQGWQVSRSTLKHERASIGNADRSEDLVRRLVELARETTRFGRPAIEDPEIRQDLAALEGWALAHKYSAFRQFSLAADGREPGLIALLMKLMVTDIGHEAARIAQELIAEDALLKPAPAGTRGRGPEKWLDQIMGSLGVSIAGGASNIQRNIIAERGLGLPRDTTGADA
ncbi:MAG: acyl-CoA dehydrogenase [Phenylobacterium sp.]|nr:acyl-CoA dehydrogenase [Phenylobacterium sp.]